MEKEIRDIIENRVAAVKNKNIDKATQAYSEDVISYDVVGKLKFTGVEAVQTRLQEWFSSLDKIVNFEITDIKITASPQTGFCSSLNHIEAKTIKGDILDMYWRETTCFAKTDGIVKITHTHSSVPFDAQSGRASIDLKPDMELQRA